VTHPDSFKSRKTLTAGGRSYAYFSLTAAEKNGLKGLSRLPYSLKILLENLLRGEDGKIVTADDARAVVAWLGKRTSEREIAFRPARVLMQDLTGVPAVVDLAAMRDAMKTLGGDPEKINPLAEVDLVIDHSVMVDNFGHKDSFKKNVVREYQRNMERYAFLRWGQQAFANFRVVPPGTGICHQVNLEYLGQTVWTRKIAEGKKAVEHAFHDQRAFGSGLGRGRYRGGSRHAGPADFHADSGGHRLSRQRQIARGRYRHRSRAHRHPDAAQEGRGGEIRGILRARPR
jgi:aconitate hydratase